MTPHSWLSAVALGVVCMVSASCAGSPVDPSVQGASSLSSSILSPELAFCTDEINRYRGSIGLAPLTRSQDLEAFSATAAQADGLSHSAHAYFHETSGAGSSRAQTEILWWQGFSIHNVIRDGLAEMWSAGPAGEHYVILTGNYTQVGCGIFTSGGEVTVAQDFR